METKSQRDQLQSDLFKKWSVALESEGGIANEHTAYTTAVVLENYFNFLSQHPILIAEDKMQTDAFTGINLALIGIIRRVIPEILAANELVGMQAMPTPKSPIFTMQFYRNDAKGNTITNQEIWKPFTSQPTEIGETFDYSSGIVKEKLVGAGALVGGYGVQDANGRYVVPNAIAAETVNLYWAGKGNQNKDKDSGFIPNGTAFILPSSVNVVRKDSTGAVLARVYFDGSAYGSGTLAATHESGSADLDGILLNLSSGPSDPVSITFTGAAALGTDVIEVGYQISFEGDANQPEMTFKITDQTIALIKRMLRGRYTLDSAFDVNVLHGINLENEMTNMIKLDLTNGISREIIDDLRKMAGIYKQVDMADYVGTTPGALMSTNGNYNDSTLVILDWINRLSAEIANRTRLSRGNWVVANPVTISFLDRVPGFVGSGVNGNERGIGFVGHLGGRLKFYADPQYPIGEFLIGRKGTSATENGYLHCPYLPITASPTMHNQLTGDPIKIFYTRYGKTFRAYDPQAKKFNNNVILNGENHYARLVIKNTAPNFSAQALTPPAIPPLP